MQQEIQQIIEKNLPAEVGKVLQERLTQAEEDRKELDKALKQIEKTDKQIEKLEKEKEVLEELNKELKERDKQVEELKKATDSREALITQKENALDKIIAEAKSNTQYERVQDMKEVISLVFRSPVYKTHISGTKPVVVPGMASKDSYGSNQYPEVRQENFDETTEITEE